MPCAISNLDCFPGFSAWWRKRSQECHFAFTRNIDSIFEVDPLSVVAFHASGKGFRGAAGTWKLHPHSPTWIYISWYQPTKFYLFVCFGQEMALITEERNLHKLSYNYHKFTLPRFWQRRHNWKPNAMRLRLVALVARQEGLPLGQTEAIWGPARRNVRRSWRNWKSMKKSFRGHSQEFIMA